MRMSPSNTVTHLPMPCVEVGVAASAALEAQMPRHIQREQVLFIGVAAVGDLYIVHKLEERVLGCLGRGCRAVAVGAPE